MKNSFSFQKLYKFFFKDKSPFGFGRLQHTFSEDQDMTGITLNDCKFNA